MELHNIVCGFNHQVVQLKVPKLGNTLKSFCFYETTECITGVHRHVPHKGIQICIQSMKITKKPAAENLAQDDLSITYSCDGFAIFTIFKIDKQCQKEKQDVLLKILCRSSVVQNLKKKQNVLFYVTYAVHKLDFFETKLKIEFLHHNVF